jgi:segregation and condensation protein A
MFQRHAVQLEPLSVRERMSDMLATVSEAQDFVLFVELFRAEEGRRGVVVTFLALTELIREGLIDFVQNEPFAPIYIRTAGE